MYFTERPIAWDMDDGRIRCATCAVIEVIARVKRGALEVHIMNLYRINFGDYKQACHSCGELIVAGKTPAWPELFTKKGEG